LVRLYILIQQSLNPTASELLSELRNVQVVGLGTKSESISVDFLDLLQRKLLSTLPSFRELEYSSDERVFQKFIFSSELNDTNRFYNY